MIIENPDAFKSWLTSILEPLCDADPAALAKYVYALVKKDKPLDELRDGMLDQLDVFLQQETKPFVEMLFKALDSQEYLKPVAEAEQPSPAQEEPELKQEVIEPETNGNGTIHQPAPERPRSPGVAPARVEAPRHRVVVQRSARPHPPPHQEQTLTKVLPLNQLLEEPVDQPPRRRDRRGDSLRDKEERRRRQSRSWERRTRARRHARDLEHNADGRRYERRRPISRSPSPRGRYRNRSPPPAVGDRQTSRSKSRSPIRDHERERDRLRAPRELERDRLSRDRDHRDRISRSRDRERSRDRSRDRSLSPHPDSRLDHMDPYKRRCRDFDVKGYCMRGDLCEWDHGVDPVVLEDAALTRVLIPPPPVPEYNPQAPDIWCGAGFTPFGPPLSLPPPPHPPHAPHTPRELVPIPRVRHEPPMGVMPVNQPRHPPPMKKNFDYNRLGPARPPLPANAANCSLEVKKVPRGLNDITHLNNHFSKFGKIVNIQVCYEGDPEGALITFSNPTEANVAYKSTEAVLNNRFIKVFWHNPENKQENTAPSGHGQHGQQGQHATPGGKQGERAGSQHPMSHNKVLINRDNIKATADNKQALADKEKQAAKEAQSNGQGESPGPGATPAAGSKRSPALRARATTAVLDMHRRAQELLQTQLRQQRLLIQRLEDGNVTESQKSTLMEAINAAQEGIEKLRKELVAYNGMLRQMQEESVARSLSRLQLEQVNSKKPKTAVEAQKEILDAELDYITKQQEGQDVTDLAKKIAEMRRQMSIQFPTHPVTMRRPHSRGGRFSVGARFTRAPAGKPYVNTTVDHRPRALLVSGFEPEEMDSLLAHFAQFGEVTGKEANLAVPELVLQFKARSQAEQAMLRARHYNDRTLSITWVTNNKPLPANIPAPVINGDAPQEETKETEVVSAVGLEPLARFDEEEEEDPDEERSWRR